MYRLVPRPWAVLRWCLPALLLLLTVIPVRAQDDLEGGLLPVKQAFQLSAQLTRPGLIKLHWTIADHYYLYRSHLKFKADPALQLGTAKLPQGHQYHDEYLGDVETYHAALDAELPYQGTGPVQLQVQYQGCHEVDPKICYPPQTETINLDSSASSHTAAAAAASTTQPDAAASANRTATGTTISLAQLGQTGPSSGSPLPASQAFSLDAIRDGPQHLRLRWQMPPGYYLYKSQIAVQLAAGQSGQLQPLHWPSGTAHHDAYYGDSVVYFDQLELPLQLSGVTTATAPLKLRVRYQGCLQNGLCYPPVERELALDSGTSTQTSAMTATSSPSSHAPGDTAATALPTLSLGLLLSALVGGLLLNLLPCVLPVLSLKVLGILDNSHELKALRRHALFYTAGVLLSFAGIDGIAHLFGQGLGAQLQRPLIVAVLACVMVAVGLALSGVFEFSSRFSNIGQSLAARRGGVGDFFTGVLAVVVASPCTGPLMGPPVAFAMTAPLASSLLVFIALGLGLALPVILIAIIPAASRYLPRPGAWMETLKQWLAFPMYVSAVWLIWVLSKQRGADATGLVLIAIVAMAMSLWWYQRSRQRGWIAKLVLLPMLVAILWPLLALNQLPASQPAVSTASSHSMAYSPQALARLQAAGTPVLVDMTADWCVTCKANEHTVLDSADFKALLQQTGTVYMKGDWTDVNPTIAAFLKHYHSPGVPLYVVFSRHGGEGEVLPSVLSPSLVKAAVLRAAQAP